MAYLKPGEVTLKCFKNSTMANSLFIDQEHNYMAWRQSLYNPEMCVMSYEKAAEV